MWFHSIFGQHVHLQADKLMRQAVQGEEAEKTWEHLEKNDLLRFQHLHGYLPICCLRSLLCALDTQARGYVRDPDTWSMQESVEKVVKM